MSSSVQTPAAVSNLLKCTLQLALNMCISLKEKESWRGTTPAVPARQIMYVWNYVCIYGGLQQSGLFLYKACSAKQTIPVQVDFQYTSTFSATLALHCVCMWDFHYTCTIAPLQMQGCVKYFMEAGAWARACSVSVPCKYAVNSPSGI